MLPLPVPVPVIVRPQRTPQSPPSRIPKTITQPPVDSPQTESDYPKPPIPPPARVRPHFARKRCTSQGMYLTKSRYMQATSALRCLAEEMLDFRLPAEDQDPDTWRLFLHRLSEADPVFLNYEANWPVYFYFNEWRQDTRRHRKRDALVSQTCRDGVHSTKRARNATQKSASQATPIIRYHSGTDGIEQCPAMTSTSIDQTARPDANYSSTSTQSSSSSSAYAHRYTDSTEFHLLLQALVPRIDDLAPAFERNGVRDLNSLRALASFPPSPFSIFLREDMGLDPFQVRQVTLALQSLQGHK